jgi:predicted transposase YbfD/YdcC
LFLAERVGVGAQDPAPGRTGQHQGRDRQQDQGKPIAGALAVDGKAMRGAVQPDGRAVHLLAAMTHAVPAVLAQRDVAHKTNEITQVKPLLEPLDLTGWVVTLDALHCQRETARYLVEDKGAGYVFTAAKDNQPRLLAALDALPWAQAPIGHTMRDRGHGRDETRTIQVLPAPAGIFPYARQAFLVERYVHDLDGTLRSAVAALGLTCLPAQQASPAHIAGLVRNHWGIEALHHIRDVTFGEDHSQLRTGSAPQVLAGLHNLAIGALRTAGRTKIAASLRWISRDPTRALDILGTPRPT